MPDTNPQETVDTHSSEVRLNRFEAEWLACRVGEALPRWQDHLPADDEPCTPDLIFHLVQLDIECRIKAGLPALLAEPYFEHPRLQHEDARLDSKRQGELIFWEYQQHWQKNQVARRSEYEVAFPQHAEALRDLKPSLPYPRCRKIIVLEKTMQTLVCPDCRSESAIHGGVPAFVADHSPAPFPSAALPVVPGYDVVEEIGRGGMGVIYKARQTTLRRVVALKMVLAGAQAGPEERARFLAEARAAARLSHPGIVQLYEVGEFQERLFLALEFVAGGSLAQRLGGKPVPPRQAAYVVELLAQAVHYAHERGVVHRDLKPGNVLLAGGQFAPKITDFGLAKVRAEEEGDIRTRTGVVMGTPSYMAPEQARGEAKEAGSPADIWALGPSFLNV